MANKSVFQSGKATDTFNEAGGPAYSLSAEEALAQLAATGTFNKTFYADETDQLNAMKKATAEVSPQFIAQCTLFARKKGGMKDMPAALLVLLTRRDPKLADKIFDRVIDNGKQLRNFVQMTSSGAIGRGHFSGSTPKRLVARWLNKQSPESLLRAVVGNSPTLSKIIRIAHPKPENDERRALYGYLRGYEAAKDGEELLVERVPRYRASKLPAIVAHFEAFKRGEDVPVPPVDFRLLAGLPNLTNKQWLAIAAQGRVIQTFKNLNTYARHGVFETAEGRALIATKLKDREEVQKSGLFPYQLLVAYMNTEQSVPFEVRDALQDAMEAAVENVPTYDMPVAVIVDVSGSMSGPVTGERGSATSTAKCIDVAALIGAIILRKNPGSLVVPVDTQVHPAILNPRDSIMTLASTLTKFSGGGTALGAGMNHLNQVGFKAGLVFVVSDMESWADHPNRAGTGVSAGFTEFKKHNRGAKLVALNLQAYGTTQAASSADTLNVGGFSDSIFETINRFLRGGEEKSWVSEIKAESI